MPGKSFFEAPLCCLHSPGRAEQQETTELPLLLSLSQGTQSSLELPDSEGS